MYFPEDMNFQYFFFDTYIGYFLQALFNQINHTNTLEVINCPPKAFAWML